MTGLAWQVQKRQPGAAEDSGQLNQETMPEITALPVVPKARYQAIRTAVDPLSAAFLLVVCAPLMLAVWSAIRLSSPGPALFRQRRAGKHGKPFTILKFRTMRPDAPAYSVKVADHDPHITTVGRFLRRSGLDELPQLWNVVRGEMAIIGPRPEQLALIDLYEPWQHQRHLVKPGITGWWQIHHRDSVPLHLNVDKDLYYIRNQGFWIDLMILVGTIKVVFVASSMAVHAAPESRRN